MKAAAFDYTRPRDLQDLLRQLAETADAKIIAAAQELLASGGFGAVSFDTIA